MGRDNVPPRRFLGQLEPVRNTPRNNILLSGVLMLVGALLLTYQFGAELLNCGAFVTFMGINAASAKRSFLAPQGARPHRGASWRFCCRSRALRSASISGEDFVLSPRLQVRYSS